MYSPKYLLIILLHTSYLICSIITNIDIIGNKKTKNKIILREIQHSIPGKFDSTTAKQDRDRIYNLGLFSTVEVNQIDSSYNIVVVETFQYLPIPLIEYEEGQGLSIGIGLAYLNFRGLNEQLVFSAIKGTSLKYYFDYYNPWIYGDHGSLFAQTYQTQHVSPNYHLIYLRKGVFIGSGFYKNKFHKFKYIIGHELLSLEKDNNNQKEIKKNYNDNATNFNYINLIFDYRFDTRDIFVDPTNGGLFTFILNPKFGLNDTPNRLNFKLSLIKYFKLSDLSFNPVLSLESRLCIKSIKGIPIFENVYLGGENYVRGYSPVIQKNPKEIQDNIEGHQIIYQNIELQHTLINKIDFNGVEIGMDIAYFFDLGVAAYNISSFKINNILIGYGCGLRLFISGAGVINIDIGFNPYGNWFIHPSED